MLNIHNINKYALLSWFLFYIWVLFKFISFIYLFLVLYVISLILHNVDRLLYFSFILFIRIIAVLIYLMKLLKNFWCWVNVLILLIWFCNIIIDAFLTTFTWILHILCCSILFVRNLIIVIIILLVRLILRLVFKMIAGLTEN